MELKEYFNLACTNRELSNLQFNKRVLDQAMDLTNPLLERCKFLSIFTSNMDEFCQVRLGTLENQEDDNILDSKTGMNAREQINAILEMFPKLYKSSSETFRFLKTELYEKGVNILKFKDLSETQKNECLKYFEAHILPRTSPMVLDPKHPLFRFENLKTYLLVHLEKKNKNLLGIVRLHNTAKRLFLIPGGKKKDIITCEELLYGFASSIFEGYDVKAKSLLRVTRNADISVITDDADDEFDYDFSRLVQSQIEKRTASSVIRLETNSILSEEMKRHLYKNLNIKKNHCFIVNGAFDYNFMFSLSEYFNYEDLGPLRYNAFKPVYPKSIENPNKIIETIFKKDILLFYPYHSMDIILHLLNEAALDKRVTSIKITIYRLAKNSKIIQALLKAAEHGKEVIVLMELTARFDEVNNLSTSDALREAGVTVFYGFKDYKVHSKIISITMEDDGQIKYITHLATGNYNEDTAKLYTDLNLLTANNEIGQDGADFFRNLAVLNVSDSYKKLIVAPKMLKNKLIEEIETEISKGKEGLIRAKFNNLTDDDIIQKLIEASIKGVKINLVIRGICCLIPGIKGLTDNINIISIVGRFLEHSRIYSFGKDERVYIASADLMSRNLKRRVEILTPILDLDIKKRVLSILAYHEGDTLKARRLTSDGTYIKIPTLSKQIDSQENFVTYSHHL